MGQLDSEFLEEPPHGFPKWLHSLHSQQQRVGVLFLHDLSALVTTRLLGTSFLTGGVVLIRVLQG